MGSGNLAYRNGYLRSEHWSNTRIAKLAEVNAKCRSCGHESVHNDVHHLVYPERLTSVKPHNLMVLCRRCHDIAHSADTKGLKGWKKAMKQLDHLFETLHHGKKRLRGNSKTKRKKIQREWLNFHRAIGNVIRCHWCRISVKLDNYIPDSDDDGKLVVCCIQCRDKRKQQQVFTGAHHIHGTRIMDVEDMLELFL